MSYDNSRMSVNFHMLLQVFVKSKNFTICAIFIGFLSNLYLEMCILVIDTREGFTNTWKERGKFTHECGFSDGVSSVCLEQTIYHLCHIHRFSLKCVFWDMYMYLKSLIREKVLQTLETTKENSHTSVDFLVLCQVFV